MDFSEYPFNVLIRNVDLGILLALTFVSWEPGFEPSALDDEIVAHNYGDQGAVVVVKWSAFLPSIPTIRVRITLTPKVFSIKLVFEKSKNKQKEA